MSPDSTRLTRVRATVKGRVQGVFFRASTAREAVALGLSGSAINLPDGRVEIIAQGPENDLKVLLDWLHRGPPTARVDAVSWEEIEPDGRADSAFTTG